MAPYTLEQIITRDIKDADLPETWQVPDIGRFSAAKTLYDYQTDTLQKAACTFYLSILHHSLAMKSPIQSLFINHPECYVLDPYTV